MLDPQIQLMRFIRDLLKHDEQLIKKGRANEEQALSTINYITVDSIAHSTPTVRKESYDYENEVMTYSQRYSQSFFIDFYGKDAFNNASKLLLLINGYESQRLQNRYNITVGSARTLVDVKQLTGREYINRCQVELILQFEKEVKENILRIESAEIEVKDDK